jgi:hypothetical protein
MHLRGSILIVVALARVAHADGTKWVETNGIEVEVPADWVQTQKGARTILAPKAYKSRAIEVAALAAMPSGKDELEKELAKIGAITIAGATDADRYGTKAIVAEGTMTAKHGPVVFDVLVLAQPKGATMVISFIKADQDPVLKKANDDILASVRIAGPKMQVIVTPTKTKGAGAPKEFEEYLAKTLAKLDKHLLLPRALPIMFVDCGQANAFYAPMEHNIRICHELFDALLEVFTKAGLDDKKAREVLIGAITFTFFHEFGHALVGELGLPITGKSEDAADEISVLMLIALGEKKAAFDGGYWFQAMVKSGHKNPFWDAHSFDQQRAVDIWCLLYGADGKTYGPFMKQLGVPDDRLATCAADYAARKKSWGTLLDAHVRHTPKPAPAAQPTPKPAPAAQPATKHENAPARTRAPSKNSKSGDPCEGGQ